MRAIASLLHPAILITFERYKMHGGILDKFSPKMFFALFHKEACMVGVIFELGWICGKYNSKQINERLRIVSSRL
jgi:hypothetical protein